MSAERNQTGDARKLPDEDARRLLTRATEIESAQSADLSISELREVALEAGITPNAFEQAVVELGPRPTMVAAEPLQPVGKVRSRFLTGLLRTAGTVAIVIATLLVVMVMVDLFG
ncbi:MAG: hypothetical protein WEE89_05645 [Gemmatimonadota bacterium]